MLHVQKEPFWVIFFPPALQKLILIKFHLRECT